MSSDDPVKHGPPEGVLVIYTGGTIGSKPNQPGDPESPQVVVEWPELRARMPEINEIGFRVHCVSLEKPLDSCNVGPKEWLFMAKAVADHYEAYKGFVILHGTDTLAYTAAVLSFMLKNLAKPVVITGAQRSALVDVRNDASQNFIASLRIAEHDQEGMPVIPEVCVCFGTSILRGNRTIKRDTSGFAAYDSPNCEPLGEVGDRIIVNPRIVRPMPTQPFQPRLRLNTLVLPIFISPGIQETKMVEGQLATPGLRAAVVMAFGSGNIPTDPAFLDTFRTAREKNGVILVDVSQCRKGPVELGIYETSAALLEAGFVAASDLGYEAAICKLMVLLGVPDLSVEEVEIEYQQAIAGEQSESLNLTRFGSGSGGTVTGGVDGRCRLRAVQLVGQWHPERIERALLRLRGAHFEGVATKAAAAPVPSDPGSIRVSPAASTPTPSLTPVNLRVFINLDPDEPPNELSPTFAGHFRRYPTGSDSTLLVLDIARAVRASVQAGERISITVFVDTPGVTLSWESAELALFVRDAPN